MGTPYLHPQNRYMIFTKCFIVPREKILFVPYSPEFLGRVVPLTSVPVPILAYIYTQAPYWHIYTHKHLCAPTYTHTHKHMHTFAYIRTHTQTHTHKHTHTHTAKQNDKNKTKNKPPKNRTHKYYNNITFNRNPYRIPAYSDYPTHAQDIIRAFALH